jgi:hypothetical protein
VIVQVCALGDPKRESIRGYVEAAVPGNCPAQTLASGLARLGKGSRTPVPVGRECFKADVTRPSHHGGAPAFKPGRGMSRF